MTLPRSDSPPRADDDLEVDAALQAPPDQGTARASMLDVNDAASRTGYLSDTSSADVNLRTAINGKSEVKMRVSSISKGKAKQEEEEEEEDAPKYKAATVACMWESCGKRYTELSTLIEHLHSDHIGTHKARYTCEWVDCPRKGNMQTSRFALLSHLRSHTGEKPFTCPLPECDKSFTRSDALAKHMKVQHQMLPSGSRRNKPLKKSNKRGSKGDEDEEEDNEMVTMSDYEPLVKSPKRPFMTFTDEQLGIKRAAWSSDDEEVLTVRKKAAEVLKTEFGVGDGLLPREQEADTDDEEGEDAAAALAAATAAAEVDHNLNTRRNSKRFKPNPLDLINSTGSAGPSSSSASVVASSDAANGGGASHERDDQKFKRLYLVEKAKLKFLQAENEEIQKEMTQLKAEEAKARDSKREALEKILTLELGQDVDAIFSPQGTPPPMPSYTELNALPPEAA